ncbi:MAG: type II toxin-antitoxin system HicA family toxin [Coriobacteriales bacterium]|nr:type II toxin-antitoxin system HicA family toxin [Coriobacteriales bacterium]
MTEQELKRLLRKAGWKIAHAGSHDQATNSQRPGVKISIPRHRGDIPVGTANSILRDAGLK